jgi:GMP synthase-like glutamine amidotransferase
MKRIHCIEHVPFETPGRIADWVVERGHSFASTQVYAGDEYPELDGFDALVVMGGPMGVHDADVYPWLVEERKLIDSAVVADKHVLGVCLGAQLLASALGARVYRNRFKEIGWFPMRATEAGAAEWTLPKKLLAFHWHGDAFELPSGAVHLAKSDACEHQMFALGTKILGIQFHLEMTREGVSELVRHCSDDIGEGPYIQSPATMLATHAFTPAHECLNTVLDRWIASPTSP